MLCCINVLVMVYFAISTFFNSFILLIRNIIVHHYPKAEKFTYDLL